MGQLTGLRTGPLPVLLWGPLPVPLWLSTSRQPCMIITIVFFLRLSVCNDLAEAMKALEGKSSELHWRDPVALSVGQPGAPVSSKDCAHGSNVLFRSRWHPGGPLGGWVEACSGFLAEPWLRWCNALQVWYWDEKKAREAPEQFCRIFSNRRPVTMHAQNFAIWMSWVIIHFRMFLRTMQWSNHCVLWQIFLVVVFVWAPAPFVCLVCCFSWRNASLAGGFAGRLAGLCVVVVVVICLHFQTVLVLVQSDVLPLMLM